MPPHKSAGHVVKLELVDDGHLSASGSADGHVVKSERADDGHLVSAGSGSADGRTSSADGKTSALASQKRSSMRKAATKKGVIPKARKPFILYYMELAPTLPGTNSEKGRIAGARWKELTQEEKQKYILQSAEEFEKQRRALLEQGEHVRGIAEAHPRKKSKTEPLEAEHAATPAAPRNRMQAQHGIVETSGTLAKFTWTTTLETLIGRGTYGQVFRAKHGPSGLVAAVKSFLSPDDDDFKAEVNVYEKLVNVACSSGHLPFFLRMYAHSEQTSSGPKAIILEYVAENHLGKLLAVRSLNTAELWSLAKQLGSALYFLHTHVGVMHLDVKPANVLFRPSDQRSFLVDFGMAESWQGETPLRYERYVTAPYRPPELWTAGKLNLPGKRSAVGSHIDVWSYGCTLFEACKAKRLFGTRNFAASTVHNEIRGYMKHRQSIKWRWHMSDWYCLLLSTGAPWCNILERCLCDAADRPSFKLDMGATLDSWGKAGNTSMARPGV